MKDTIEYQIFIGCNDSQLKREVISIEELIEVLTFYFEQKKINFTLFRATGGYHNSDDWYITENSLCINIIGPSDLDIIKLSKGVSMIMNQEHSLIVKNKVVQEFN